MVVNILLEKNGVGGLEGLPLQGHSCFFRGKIALAGIASLTCGDQVGPGLPATTGTGQDMIQREVFFCAAVLAFKPVSPEDILTGKADDFIRSVDIAIQPDHGGHGVGTGDGIDPVVMERLHQFTLIEKHQHKGTFDRTHHERAEILIKYQHPAVHAEKVTAKPLTGQRASEADTPYLRQFPGSFPCRHFLQYSVGKGVDPYAAAAMDHP